MPKKKTTKVPNYNLELQNKKKICTACPTEKNEKPINCFYISYSNLDADGRVSICKDCIQNLCYDEKTDTINLDEFKKVLMRIDKPFISKIWQTSIDSYNRIYGKKNIQKGNCKRIISHYMKNINSLKQYFTMNWQEGLDYERAESIMRNPIDNTKIVNSMYEQPEELEVPQYNEIWRGTFTKADLEYLDKYYSGLQRDYKIITENHKDYARKIAKASLQMDKCFDAMMAGEKDADKRYDNAKNAFDTLCKSGKFSESTRSLNDVGISSFSIITDRVEAHNWIPEHIPEEKDVIDKLLDVLSIINKSV